MSGPWGTEPAFSGSDSGAEGHVTLLEGSTFCISAPNGDMTPGQEHGVYVRDTRVVSQWRLTVDGRPTDALGVQHANPFSAAFPTRVPRGEKAASLLVVRRRYVGEGMREDVTVQNWSQSPVTCDVVLGVDADFADLFEVKDGRALPDGLVTRGHDDGFSLRATRSGREFEVLVRADQEPQSGAHGLRWRPTIEPHGSWTTSIEVAPAFDGQRLTPHHSRVQSVDQAQPARKLRAWRRNSPRVHSPHSGFVDVLARSLEDLGTLRIFDPAHPDRPVVAAGAPWYMALFGRDSLLTSWMMLAIDSELALGTLQTLAEHQGTGLDPQTEEQPGRILHEMRFGPAVSQALGGKSAYYGTVDASALFVMLVAELHRWGQHREEALALLPHVDRCLEWMLEYGDRDGDGFVEYARATPSGLLNQGWKDSWDGVNFADGRLAETPIALAEVQGYTYAAYLSRAYLASVTGDEAGAAEWRTRARRLRDDFDEAFWLPDRGWYAVGLDRDKRPIDALTSNLGHCLWTGIVDMEKAESVVGHLMSPEMFTGWGVRTLATSMGAYDPLSYHNGSVWPHDNAICVDGLMRYGFVEDAQRVAVGMLEAAAQFGNRLPELFGGFDRSEFAAPVPYPTSCSPQAWAAAAPVQLLRSLLRVDPSAVTAGAGEDAVELEPAVPAAYLPLRVDNVRVGGAVLNLEVRAEGCRVEVVGER